MLHGPKDDRGGDCSVSQATGTTRRQFGHRHRVADPARRKRAQPGRAARRGGGASRFRGRDPADHRRACAPRRREPAIRHPLLPLRRRNVLRRVQDPARDDADRRRRLPPVRPRLRRRRRAARAVGDDERGERRSAKASTSSTRARSRAAIEALAASRRIDIYGQGSALGGDGGGRQAPPLPPRNSRRRLLRRPAAAHVRRDARAWRCGVRDLQQRALQAGDRGRRDRPLLRRDDGRADAPQVRRSPPLPTSSSLSPSRKWRTCFARHRRATRILRSSTRSRAASPGGSVHAAAKRSGACATRLRGSASLFRARAPIRRRSCATRRRRSDADDRSLSTDAMTRAESYDHVFRNALLVDGTGGAPFRGELAIAGETIAAIGAAGSDASGQRRARARSEGQGAVARASSTRTRTTTASCSTRRTCCRRSARA